MSDPSSPKVAQTEWQAKYSEAMRALAHAVMCMDRSCRECNALLSRDDVKKALEEKEAS